MLNRFVVVPIAALSLAVAACSGTAATATAPAPAAPTATTAAPTAAASSTTVATAVASPTGAAAERINGTIKSVSNGQITLDNGKSFTVPSSVRIIRTVPMAASDLKAGQYVAVTAKRQPDNTLLASVVNIFPSSMKGVGVGQRPMGGGDLMTNATIQSVNGNTFTVTFPGGGAHIKLGAGAHVNEFQIGTSTDLKTGIAISALVSGGQAKSVAIVGPASSNANSQAAGESALTVEKNAKVGSILADGTGRTLYVFTKDKPNVSNCSGKCATIWPPFTETKSAPTLPAGVTGTIGVITRSDGTHQLTYNGLPLYYFNKDTKAGETNGEGFGGVWSVVTLKSTSGSTGATPTPAASSGSGY